MEKRQTDWEQRAAIGITIALWGLGGYLLFRYAFGAMLPFLLAFAIATAVRPIATALSARLHWKQNFCAFLITLLLLALLIGIVCFGCNRLLVELTRLGEWLTTEEQGGMEAMMDRVIEWFGGLGDRIPFLRQLRDSQAFEDVVERMDELVSAALTGLVGELSARLPSVAGKLASAMPSMFLFFITFLLSCFYFATEDGTLCAFVVRILPPAVTEKMRNLLPRLKRTALRYLRAYLLLMAITFGELFVGFLILGMQYAFLPAFLISLIDLLPVFGTGTVLVPWAVLCLLAGDVFVGTGLLILYGVTLLVREVIEPHIVGGSLGLHPLLTLFAMYVGYRLFGFGGLLLGPVILIVARAVLFPAPDATEHSPVVGQEQK